MSTTIVTCDVCKEPNQEVGQECDECGEIMLAPRTCDVCNEPDQEVGQPCVQCGEILYREYVAQDDDAVSATRYLADPYTVADTPFSEMVTTDESR